MSEEMSNIEIIAKVCHEANRAYCQTLGDNSQPPWEEAPRWQTDSACQGVAKHLQEGLTPEQSHESWFAHKVADGWKYGPVKDPDKKEHPCMVPYDQLPEEQQRKDKIFKGIVEAWR